MIIRLWALCQGERHMVTMHVFAVTGIRCHTQYLARSVTLDTAVSLPRTSRVLQNRRYVFNAKHENRDAPKRLTANELQVELEKVRHITPGNHPGNGSGKRKHGRVEERLLFNRRSTLWDLEYWKDLDLRHNLDVITSRKIYVTALSAHFLILKARRKIP